MVESYKKEDIVVDEKGNQKSKKHKESRMNESKRGSKKTMNNDSKSHVHSIYRGDGLFDNWRELKRCPKISHHNVHPVTHDHYSSTCTARAYCSR